jgi:hypothetical protein
MTEVHFLGRSLMVLLFLGFFHNGRAQGNFPSQQNESNPSKLALGASLSTMGAGGNLSLSAGKSWILNVGYEQMAFNLPFSFDENGIDYDADLAFKTGSLSLIADFHYFRALYISAGAGFNQFHPVIDGIASSSWKYGDIYIPAEDIGSFNFEVQPAYTISPYVGVGVGHKVSRSGRLSFSLEAGTYYQGPPKVKINATGLLSPTADEAHGQKRMLENQFSTWRYYPVMRMGLSYLLTK